MIRSLRSRRGLLDRAGRGQHPRRLRLGHVDPTTTGRSSASPTALLLGAALGLVLGLVRGRAAGRGALYGRAHRPSARQAASTRFDRSWATPRCSSPGWRSGSRSECWAGRGLAPRHSLRESLVRGGLAALGSGLAFYAISGIWTRFDPRTIDYPYHLLCWTIAFSPGLSRPAARTKARLVAVHARRKTRAHASIRRVLDREPQPPLKSPHLQQPRSVRLESNSDQVEVLNGRGQGQRRRRKRRTKEEGLSRAASSMWSLPVGWAAFSAACAASLVATARFLFPNVLFEPPQSFKAGFPSEYNVGEVDVRFKDAFGVWIVREADGFYALIAVCTHLGCSPNWLPTENKFKCPCHGSGFYRSGRQLRGPRAAAARARAHRARRRRPDPGGQVGEVPGGEGRVDEGRVVPQGLSPRSTKGFRKVS